MPDRSIEKYVEVVGQQLRIRVSAPKHYNRFYTFAQDKGRRTVRGVTVAGKSEVQSYRLNLSENTKGSARKWIKSVPCSGSMKKRARKLVDAYYNSHKGDPPIIRYKNGKRLRGHVLAVQLNSERSARARSMDAHQNNRHLLRNPTDANIWKWWSRGRGRRYDMHNVDTYGRKAGKTKR